MIFKQLLLHKRRHISSRHNFAHSRFWKKVLRRLPIDEQITFLKHEKQETTFKHSNGYDLLNSFQIENLFPSVVNPDKDVQIYNKKTIHSNHLQFHQKSSMGKISNEVRRNEVNIEMLPRTMHEHIFGNDKGEQIPPELVDRARKHLRDHNLLNKITDALPDVNFPLPPLQGKNIEEHFYNIGEAQAAPYRKLVVALAETSLPAPPTTWCRKPGWTKYEPGKPACMVPYPEESSLVFDIEECVQAGLGPTLATAVSPTAWYSWVSDALAAVLAAEEASSKGTERRHFTPQDLINLESCKTQLSPRKNQTSSPKVIIGHNVSFDRARIKEQYWVQSSNTRFIDTLSLHVAVSGVTSYQKTQLLSGNSKKNEELKLDLETSETWRDKSSLNNLNEVHKLYCGGEDIDKSSRDVFISGTLLEVANSFDELVSYCANDVKITHKVIAKLFPLFLQRFPHPVTLAGILELSVAYLPVNQSWNNYIRDTNETHNDLEAEAKYLLTKQANEACRLLHDSKYKNDPWLWDQDWSVQEMKLKKTATKNNDKESDWDEEDHVDPSAEKFRYLVQLRKYLPARRLHLPGYPAWYRRLCPRLELNLDSEDGNEWTPGPTLVSTPMTITPKLLRLTWDGYPLHKLQKEGWGLLIPGRPASEGDAAGGPPVESLQNMCPVSPMEQSTTEVDNNVLVNNVEKNISRKDFYEYKRKQSQTNEPAWYLGSGVWCPNAKIPGCWFRKLPHPEGSNKNVGNPLARDFVTRLSEGTLHGEGAAATILEIGNAVSYWRNNRERVESQQVVWLQQKSLPNNIRSIIAEQGSDVQVGAIIPQLLVCGTLTRRAVEKTWLTASNAEPTRIGSELRAMIRAPPGYHLVGADVDSQELWLAALLGDAAFASIHGATAFGWRTLQGRKSDGTDLHSATAKAAGTSRHHAKVMNYARIYGAGTHFIQQLLKRFCPGMTDEETKKAAFNTMTLTKGRQLYILPKSSIDVLVERGICSPEYPSNENNRAKKKTKAYVSMLGEFGFFGDDGELYLTKRELEILRKQEQMSGFNAHNYPSMTAKRVWYGGTESAMFNILEKIACSDKPCTPFLEARLSRALEPCVVGADNYVTTRVNWVVQSSAVDFLHLMLVSMRWLLGDSPSWRFVLSFHDEVRYMVPSERRYEAALALHATNLFARAFCARRIGIHDLPRSVAFFSAVEVDVAMRKDANSDCSTPSNPHGLSRGYGVPSGETLDVYSAVSKAGNNVKLGKSKNEKKIKTQGPFYYF